MTRSCLASLGLTSALTLLATTVAAQKKSPEPSKAPPASGNGFAYDDALVRYRQVMPRLSMHYHTEGREKLAATGKPDALQILIEDYQKGKAWQEFARYSLATMFGKHFDNAASLPALIALRNAHNKAGDAWLWYNTLRIQVDRADQEEVQQIAATHKSVMLRAAALLALGEARRGDLKRAMVTTCADFPKREWERAMLVGAMSGIIAANKSLANDPEFRKGLEAYVGLLAPEVGLSHTIKVQMARHLQWLLKAPAAFVDPESWLRILASGDVKKTDNSRTGSAPRFFGVETDGERMCYVVDMSDSMCKPIAPSAKPEGPTTGPKQKKPKGVLPDESDLPWHKINTRWDLAREQLKISLWRLPDDKYFSIVWFGTGSGMFESTKSMVRATKTNIDRAIAELDSITMGKPMPDRPDGVLRGDTNLHSGIKRAFGLADKGYVEAFAYVDPEAMVHGCDTILLLTDGEPSSDDLEVVDKDYGEGQVVSNVESGAPAARTPQIRYWGPYRQPDWLVADVKRMNAFRRIKIHCVGLGEARMDLLRQIAEVGHGEAISVGAK
ncbi:MAG: hypothetical protein JNK49_11710 [Planctomycetes bacterium]|nr:hypothetical protein [Planctomycetota bacterium]